MSRRQHDGPTWIVATNAGHVFAGITDLVRHEGMVNFTAPDGEPRRFPEVAVTVTAVPAPAMPAYRYRKMEVAA